MTRRFGNAEVKIRDASFEPDYRIIVELDNGRQIVYDMQSKLMTARFSELSDPELFYSGWVKDGRIICWSMATELTLDEILSGMAGANEQL